LQWAQKYFKPNRLFTWFRNDELLTAWSRDLLEKLFDFHPVKKFPAFMEPEGSLPHSQVPAACLSPDH
jgi:hypothetical protein